MDHQTRNTELYCSGRRGAICYLYLNRISQLRSHALVFLTGKAHNWDGGSMRAWVVPLEEVRPFEPLELVRVLDSLILSVAK